MKKEAERILKTIRQMTLGCDFLQCCFRQCGLPSCRLEKSSDSLSVRRQCELLGLNRSAIYKEQKQPDGATFHLREKILSRIDCWHMTMPYLGSLLIPSSNDTAVNKKDGGNFKFTRLCDIIRSDVDSSITFRATNSTPNLGKVPVLHRGLYHALYRAKERTLKRK